MLFYWRRDDYADNMRDGPDFHLNRSQRRLHNLDLEDSLWAITLTDDGRYVVAAELIVAAKTGNSPGYVYGAYRVWGDPDRSRYFDVAEQPDAEPLLRDLSFQPTSRVLAQSFQGPGGLRELSAEDEARLRDWSGELPLYPSDRIALESVTAARLHIHQQGLTDAGEFDPASVVDARERTVAAIVRRRGQPEFRQRLIAAYAGRCAISGCDAVEALEAAHIIPYQGEQTNHPTNGLLLRADLHTLFDLGLIAVDVATMTVVIAPVLKPTTYAALAGIPLYEPEDVEARPSRSALEDHCSKAGL